MSALDVTVLDMAAFGIPVVLHPPGRDPVEFAPDEVGRALSMLAGDTTGIGVSCLIDHRPTDKVLSGAEPPRVYRGSARLAVLALKPEDRPADKILAALAGLGYAVRRRGRTWRAKCPYHGGQSDSSLSVLEFADGGAWVHCFGGCQPADVLATLGIDKAEIRGPGWTGTHRAGSTIYAPGSSPPLPATAAANGHGPLLTAADLLALDIPELESAVVGVLTEGLGLLVGKPKGGKSWLLLQLALAVASGAPFFGHPTVPGDVLYLGLEDGRRRMKDRLQKVLRGAPPPAGLTVVTVEDKWGRADEGGLERIVAWMEAHPQGRMVLIDTIGRFRPMGDGRRNAYMSDLAALEPLQAEALRRHVAILCSHHDNKTIGHEDWVYSISGTQAIAGTADTLWHLGRRQGSDMALFKTHGRDIGEACLILRFDAAKRRSGPTVEAPSFTWRSIGAAAPGAPALTGEREMVLRLLDERGPLTLAEIARCFGDETYDAVRMRVARMSDAGLVNTEGSTVSVVQAFGAFGTDGADPTEQTERTERVEHTEQTERGSRGGGSR